MALEAELYRALAGLKTFDVPMYARLWVSYRCWLDKQTLGEKGPLHWSRAREAGAGPPTDEQLHHMMRASSPKGFRGGSRDAKHARKREGLPLWRFFFRNTVAHNSDCYLRHTDKRGFGVFARRHVSFDEVRRAFPGWLCPISAETYETLFARAHPSLYSYGGRHYVLSGPLSMLNHQCGARTGYGRPRSFPVDGFETPSFHTLDTAPEVDRAKLLMLKDVSLDAEGEHPAISMVSGDVVTQLSK